MLEAGYAAVLIARDGALLAPPLDGRILDSISRRETLAAAERLGLSVRVATARLGDLDTADAIILTSSLRGPHPGRLHPDPPARAADELCTRLRRELDAPGG